jgi:hypothetical protein
MAIRKQLRRNKCPYCVAVGDSALRILNAGADGYNVAVGNEAGTNTTTGIANTFVGALSGNMYLQEPLLLTSQW